MWKWLIGKREYNLSEELSHWIWLMGRGTKFTKKQMKRINELAKAEKLLNQ